MARKSENANRREAARRTGDADYLQRRAELVSAAGQVFRRKGFQASNLNDIAAEAGVDRASLYYYVSSKQDFFEEIVFGAVEMNLKVAVEILGMDISAPAKIRILTEKLMSSYEEHYPYLFVYVQENMAHLDGTSSWHHNMKEYGQKYAEVVNEIIRQGIESGSLRPPGPLNAQLLAHALIGMCNWSHRWFRPDGELRARDIGVAFADLFLRGIEA